MASKKNVKLCQRCNKHKKVELNFYTTSSKMYPDGRLNICKSCLKDMIDPNNVESLKSVLRTIDKPFLAHVWNSSLESKDPTGNYLRMLASLPQYKGLTWENSIFESITNTPITPRPDRPTIVGAQIGGDYIDPTVIANKEQAVTDEVPKELFEKWGRNFSGSEILDFEAAYKRLRPSFEIENENQDMYLRMACIYQVKALQATSNNDTKGAKDFTDMFNKVTQQGNLTPAQNKKDLALGINSFAEMVKKVEETVDVIPILPKFRERPQDKVDIVIWAFANYIRNLKGLPDATYDEIWRWYDGRKKAYEDMLARLAELDKGDGGDEE